MREFRLDGAGIIVLDPLVSINDFLTWQTSPIYWGYERGIPLAPHGGTAAFVEGR
jgi:hypothetical protein